jgi:Na+/phosphate symporter
MKKKKCDVVSGIIFIELLAELEKVGDHLSNIAERASEIQKHHLELKSDV